MSDSRFPKLARKVRVVSSTLGSLTAIGLLVACSVYEAPELSSPAESGGATDQSGLHSPGGTISAAGASSSGMAGAGNGGTPTVGNTDEPAAGMASEFPSADADADAGAGGGSQDPVTPDPPDMCPSDPDKLAPGACGCGVPDVATRALAGCQSIKSKLLHRYDFEGTGTLVKDRVGNADGSIPRGATLSKLDGRGVVLLGGGDVSAYVDLPNHLISPLTSTTIELWVTWGGGAAWQRFFDFGDTRSDPPENTTTGGRSYLFLSASSSLGFPQVGYSRDGADGASEVLVDGTSAFPLEMAHAAVVADATAQKLSLYLNGAKVASSAWTGKLSDINDVNVWLGRSQSGWDPELGAVYHEFRIYSAALSDAELATSFIAGPDPAFLAY